MLVSGFADVGEFVVVFVGGRFCASPASVAEIFCCERDSLRPAMVIKARGGEPTAPWRGRIRR